MAINVSNLGTFMIGSLRSTDITLQGSSGNDLKISANPAATTSYQMVMPQTNGTLGDVLTIGGGSDLVWAPPTGITSVTATSTLGANKSGQMVVKDGNVDDRIIRLAGPRMVENGTGFDIANLNINGNVLKHFDGSGDVDIQLSPGHHTRILSPTSSPVVTIGEDGDVIAKSLQLGDSEPLGGASNPTSLQFVSGGINVLVDTTIDADLSLPDNHNLNLGNDDDLVLVHNGTNNVITSTTGNLLVDNQNVTGETVFKLGTATAATAFQVKNSAGNTLFKVAGDGTISPTGAITGSWIFTGTKAGILGTLDIIDLSSTSIDTNIRVHVNSGLDVVDGDLTLKASGGKIIIEDTKVIQLSTTTAVNALTAGASNVSLSADGDLTLGTNPSNQNSNIKLQSDGTVFVDYDARIPADPLPLEVNNKVMGIGKYIAMGYEKVYRTYNDPIVVGDSVTYIPSQIATGVIVRTSLTGSSTDTFPTAAAIYAEFGSVNNRGLVVYIKNQDLINNITFTPNSGVVFFANSPSIGPQATACVLVIAVSSGVTHVHFLWRSGV